MLDHESNEDVGGNGLVEEHAGKENLNRVIEDLSDMGLVNGDGLNLGLESLLEREVSCMRRKRFSDQNDQNEYEIEGFENREECLELEEQFLNSIQKRKKKMLLHKRI